MVITIIILLCIIAALLTSHIYYRSKFYNYYDISNKAEADLENIENELDICKKEHIKKLDSFKNNLKRKYSNKFKEAIKLKEEEFETKFETLKNELEQDYNSACDEVKSEIFKQLEEIDNALAEHAENIALKNVLTFSCSCSKDLIPVPIDFTKENTFICKKCGSKYRVAINANPILVGRSISDEEFAGLLEKRLNEEEQ
jgi:hypothetical protein